MKVKVKGEGWFRWAGLGSGVRREDEEEREEEEDSMAGASIQ